MAITLAHAAKLEKDPLRKMIITNMLREGQLLDYLPFENVNALRSVAVRWTNLPDVAFRKINADYTASEGDVEQVYENVFGFGGTIEHDRVWDKVKGSMIKDPVQLAIEQKSKAMALTFNYYFIKGDHLTDVDGFEGLEKRIDNMPSRQKVQLGAASATAVDPTSSAATARDFLDSMDEAAYKANRGDFQVILCNEGVRWGIHRVLRYAAVAGGPLLDVTKDDYGRDILTYKGAPIIDMGLKTDQSTEIILNTETAADAGSDSTSMYFVPFNTEQGIIGIQLSDLEVFEGAQTKSTTEITAVEWWCGLAGFGSYGPVRMWNIEDPSLWT
jgi:hypothetical protein